MYYDAVGELYSYIRKNIQDRHFDCPDIIQIGFWPGGDRDGNPFVTWETTRDVADELRMTLMKCYYQELKGLEKKLTFREVEDIVENIMAKLYVTMFDPAKTIRYEEIVDPLHLIKSSLIDKYNSLYLEELENLIDKVTIFKTHFATLDIRQNHSVHKQVIQEILKREKLIDSSLEELGNDELLAILLRKDISVNPDQFENEIVKDTLRTIRQMKSIQSKNGEEGCNRYIISNTEDIFAVLFVYSLFRWCCWGKEELPVDIIPLFESMQGMANADSIMQELFNLPEYRSHIDHRRNKQTIMLGFSDGTKDGGYRMLMEEEPVSRRSIEIREQIVLPLLVIQQYALQKIESNSKQRAIYEKIVERSLYGNINASRNSA